MATNKTYTFSNGQPADGTQVNKNFDDLLAGINAGVSATDKVLGRATAGAGPVEEIPCTAAGRALLDDASATVQIATLGLDADIVTLVLPANTTISAAGAELINDADAAAQRATLGNVVVTGDSRLSDARVASDVYAWAKAPTAPVMKAITTGSLAGSDVARTTVTHGLGATPSFVEAITFGGNSRIDVNAITSTTFSLGVVPGSGTVIWIAVA